jgi:hypothetical protein
MKLPGGKGLLASKADNLTAICDLIVLNNVSQPYGPPRLYLLSFPSHPYWLLLVATLEHIQVITEVALPVLPAAKVPLWPSHLVEVYWLL